MKKTIFLLCGAVIMFCTLTVHAQESLPKDIAHTLWILVAGSMVFLMQAGFALLESGMVRSKNTINVMMKNYIDMCVGAFLFWLIGYGLMFGNNPTGWIGTDLFGLARAPDFDFTLLFFQMMFAATAATIVSGAMAERTNYMGYLLGACGISAVIYPVFGAWAWNSNGWLKSIGFIDFAGSTVVHSVGGWCALAAIIILGPRLGKFGPNGELRDLPGHNLGYVAIGGFLLWFGWFGFNGGSTLEANTAIGPILLNTHMAGSAGAVGAILVSLFLSKNIKLTSVVNGSIAGLVAITAGCATMDLPFAVLTGFIGGMLCVLGMRWLDKLRLDDVVGAVAVHGFCGAWGTLAAGIFLKGNMFDIKQILVQLVGILAAFIWVMLTALLMYRLIFMLTGLRSDTMHEQRGLDITEHGEIAYPEFGRDVVYNSSDLKSLKKL